MTNILETAKTTATRALGHLAALLAGGTAPGESHLAGPLGARAQRASTIDEDLDVLLHEIQRRRGAARA